MICLFLLSPSFFFFIRSYFLFEVSSILSSNVFHKKNVTLLITKHIFFYFVHCFFNYNNKHTYIRVLHSVYFFAFLHSFICLNTIVSNPKNKSDSTDVECDQSTDGSSISYLVRLARCVRKR